MKKLQAALRRLVARAPKPRTLALDLTAAGGLASVVHGVALYSPAAAWILGGLVALVGAILLNRGGKA